MEGINTPGNPERRNLLLEEIQAARTKAMPFEEIQAMKDEHDRAVRQFLKGEIPIDVMQERINALDDEAGIIQRKGIVEFIELLRAIGVDEDGIKRIAAHENEHLMEALSQGADPLYQIQFMTRVNGGKRQMGIYPSVAIFWPQDVSEETKKEALKSIIEAPEVLSPSDKAKLGE